MRSQRLESHMKIRPLPDIDLARIAPQSDDIKRKSLEQMKSGYSTFSYKPVRSLFDDIFNIQPALDFGKIAPTNWEKIHSELSKRCRSDDELLYNERVARSLYKFAKSTGTIGRREEFFPLSMGIGRKVTYWLPMIVSIDSAASAIFIDPRSTKKLTADGRRFAFSMMHERIRTEDEDFSDLSLTIAQFGKPESEGGLRTLRLYSDKDEILYSREELELMVASTYDLWREVLEERERESRDKPTGTGPLI